MSESISSPRVCVIGTGPRGIAACRALSERGVPFVVTLAGGYAERTADTAEIHAAAVARAITIGESLD